MPNYLGTVPSTVNAATHKLPHPTSLGVILLGVPVVLILSGTRFGPIVVLSLAAVLIYEIVTPVDQQRKASDKLHNQGA